MCFKYSFEATCQNVRSKNIEMTLYKTTNSWYPSSFSYSNMHNNIKLFIIAYASNTEKLRSRGRFEHDESHLEPQ